MTYSLFPNDGKAFEGQDQSSDLLQQISPEVQGCPKILDKILNNIICNYNWWKGWMKHVLFHEKTN